MPTLWPARTAGSTGTGPVRCPVGFVQPLPVIPTLPVGVQVASVVMEDVSVRLLVVDGGSHCRGEECMSVHVAGDVVEDPMAM
jgi:hypothetical protein